MLLGATTTEEEAVKRGILPSEEPEPEWPAGTPPPAYPIWIMTGIALALVAAIGYVAWGRR